MDTNFKNHWSGGINNWNPWNGLQMRRLRFINQFSAFSRILMLPLQEDTVSSIITTRWNRAFNSKSNVN